jgi:outer membrane receptor protein involved in Fe transport
MQKNIQFLLVALFCMAASAKAQNATIYGMVKDSAKTEELGSATIRVGDKGTISDVITGEYRLEIPAGKQQVEISYVGYTTKVIDIELAEGESKNLDILLAETFTMLKIATVTSSKFAKALSDVTVSLEVIQPDLIANRNTISVSEVLGVVPGVNMIDDQVDIRGGAGFAQGTGGRVLMLMDDMPIMQADAGLTNWRDLPTENVAQIEVLKGAASALYGSAAMNGIINIRTAYPTETPVTKISVFHTAYGSPSDTLHKWWNKTNAPYETGVQIGHRQRIGKKLDLVAGVNFYDNQSYIRGGGIDSTPNFDKKFRTTLNLRYRITDRLSVSLNTNFNTGRQNRHLYWTRQMGQSLYESDPTSIPIRGNNTRITIDPSVTYFDKKDNRHRLQTRYYRIQNDNANAQSNSSNFVYGEYQFQRRFANLQNLELSAGIVGSHTSVKAEVYGDYGFGLTNVAAFLQLEKKFIERLNVSFGFRYELNHLNAPDSITFGFRQIAAGDTTEARPVIRLGLNYKLTEGTFLRASFGQAYRFPTILEKYVATSAGGGIRTYPNPYLTSETGWSAEVGVKQGFKIGEWQGFVDVAGFWTEYFNMTEFQAEGSIFGFWVQNVGDTRITGIDGNIAGQGMIGKVKFDLLTGYTYINPTFQNFDSLTQEGTSSEQNVLKYRFRHTFKFDGQGTYKGFGLGASLQYFSFMEAIDRYLNDYTSYPTIPNFRDNHNTGTWLLMARASYSYKNAKLSLLVNNVMNTEFSVRPGVLEAPRNLSIRADFTF